jgi:hypothetical protein
VEVGSNTSTVALLVVGDDKKGNLESETVKYGPEYHGTRTREWMRWRRPAAIVNYRPIFSSERALYMDQDRRCSIEKKKSGRESQGTRRQDELIGGIPSVVKWLWLWLWFERQQKGKSRIWGSKIWLLVPRDSDPRMNVLARASSNCKWQTHPLFREDVI